MKLDHNSFLCKSLHMLISAAEFHMGISGPDSLLATRGNAVFGTGFIFQARRSGCPLVRK